MDLPTLAWRTCLQNAIQHDGTCQPKGLVGRIMGGHPEFRRDPAGVMAALVAAADKVNAMSVEEQSAALEQEAPELLETKSKERRTGLKELPGDTSRVVMRFAPNPNGPLSLGHSRGLAILAQYRRAYEATLILRLDDTDPQVKPPLWDEARGWNGYDMVREDFQWLTGTAPDRIVKASDRLGHYYDAARTLIDRDGAYVCTCQAEAFRELKNAGTPCPCRSLEAAGHKESFDAMVAGARKPGSCVLRVKTDILHKDPALRDWTAFRVVAKDAVHPRAKAGEIPDHRCWPLLDFESAVEDHLQGVTHVIRGKDLMDSTRKQKFLYQHMGWEYPHTLYWGRISLHGFGKFSTSMMRRHIEAGDFTGWDDPRLPTLRALARRGFLPEALAGFWVGLGLTEKDISVSMANVEAEDARLIDTRSPRRFFVPAPVALRLVGADGLQARPLVHPNHPDRGHRTLDAEGQVWVCAQDVGHPRLRLKDLGNVTLSGSQARFDDTRMDRALPIVQWLPASDALPFKVLRPGGPAAGGPEGDEGAPVPAPPEAPDVPEGPEPVAPLLEEHGLVEGDIAGLVGSVVQFERYGFVRIEAPDRGVWLHA